MEEYNENLESENSKQETVNKDRKKEDSDNDKKIKNFISIIILLCGLLVGSLFVDVGQIIKSNGYSQKNLNKADIFEASGKTWVAYSEPAISVSVITDDDCEDCDPGEILAWLRRVLPTISAEKVDFESERGKNLIGDFGIKTLPAFIFEKDIKDSQFYAEAQSLFYVKGDKYILNVSTLGAPVGKYLELPQINSSDVTFGSKDSKVKVVIFLDFQCPYCKVFYSSLKEVMEEYKDKVLFGFKELPLVEIHSQSENAALASMCALEQDKFWEYINILYAKQNEWEETIDIKIFKTYARNLSLNVNDFASCLDSKKYQDKINTDINQAQDFGITGTPTIFIGDKVETGVLSADEFKADIEEQLK